jgi:hypothetical protein
MTSDYTLAFITCEHCGKDVAVTSYRGIVPLYCKKTCKRNACNRRRKRRKATEERGELVPCPRPDKVPYETRRHAEVVANNELIANGKELYPYDEVCPCGSWHLTSTPRNVEPDPPADAPRRPEPEPQHALSADQIELLREHFPTTN